MRTIAARLLVTAVMMTATAGCLVPQMAMTRRERGDSFLSHGHYDAAVYQYTRAIEADGNDWEAYAGRAQAHSRNIDLYQRPRDKRGANIPAALADYDRAIALRPGAAQLYLNRGVVRAADDQLDAALADMDQAVRLDPSNGLTHGYRGFVLLRMGRDGEAQAEFDRCTRAVPASRRELSVYVKRIKAMREKSPT